MVKPVCAGYPAFVWVSMSYARVTYSSVMANTTSSSYFLQSESRKGRREDFIASVDMSVATMEILW